ncbi:MAG: hypothetical protein ACYC0N_00380 [Carboxydocellales bacterium]
MRKLYKCGACGHDVFRAVEITNKDAVNDALDCANCGKTYFVGMCNTNGLQYAGKKGALPIDQTNKATNYRRLAPTGG